uniref:Uncharacterized protein n=1 Tax=Arundo donax TaxID=35708 RepID=A0A0A9CYA8_ARUDO
MGWSPLKLIWEASKPGSQRSRLCSSRSLTSTGSPVMKMVRTSSAAAVPGAPGTGGGGGTAAEAAGAPGGGGAAAAGGHCWWNGCMPAPAMGTLTLALERGERKRLACGGFRKERGR